MEAMQLKNQQQNPQFNQLNKGNYMIAAGASANQVINKISEIKPKPPAPSPATQDTNTLPSGIQKKPQ